LPENKTVSPTNSICYIWRNKFYFTYLLTCLLKIPRTRKYLISKCR